MNAKLTTIEVSPEIAEILKAKAMVRQLPLDKYLLTLLENDIANRSHSSLSIEEFDRDMDELARDSLPVLPCDFSRADIYADHD